MDRKRETERDGVAGALGPRLSTIIIGSNELVGRIRGQSTETHEWVWKQN